MKSIIARFLFGISGWKIINEEAVKDLRKCLFAVAPHTSWQDVFVGFFTRAIIRKRVGFLGKHTLFRGPFGWVFRMLGGYPVDRTKKSNLVEITTSMFADHDPFYLAIAPEGTRQKVKRFRSGFYYMALGAGIPLILTKLDFANKRVVFSDPFYPSGDREKDMIFIYRYFDGVIGKIPERSFFIEKPDNDV